MDDFGWLDRLDLFKWALLAAVSAGLVLPLIGSQGEPDLALGCLCTKGTVGRTPRRFTISRMLREPIIGQSQADLAREDLHRAFAEPPRPFHPPKGGSHLRLVVSR